ncbi:MAG: J domain-containing protein [Myxococcales bacterium]|nr:J domain-containing protein [Myxococcales bacterium]
MAQYQPDHYRVLGVPVDAEPKRLKEAYHRLSRVYHPDLRGGSRAATERFQLIAAAYGELSDAAQREQYDRKLVLMDPLRLVDDPRAERALDRIDGLVGRLRRRPKALPLQKRGRDLRVKAEVPLHVAALGGIWPVAVDYETTCGGCAGIGTTEPELNPGCHVCDGAGKVKVGLRRQLQTCNFCHGRGEVLLAPCADCSGSGRLQDRRDIKVKIPRRMRDGATLRVRGAGERPIGGGPPGDVIVTAKIASHPLLEVRGDDLICQLPLTWTEAIGGCTRQVPTLSGPQRLRIPPGSWSGRELRIGGQGMPRQRTGRGDLRYILLLDSPADLSADELSQVAQLESRLGSERFARRVRFVRALDELDPPSE